MKRLVITLVLTLMLVLIPAVAVFADTTADVEVTATPTYIAMTNSEATWPLGQINASSDFWWKGTAPEFPLDDAECSSTITNTGNVNIDVTVTGVNFTGGVGWTLAGTVGENIVVFKAGKSGDALEANMVTLTTSAQAFIPALPHTTSNTIMWEMKLSTGTFTDGAEKTSTVTLTAAEAA